MKEFRVRSEGEHITVTAANWKVIEDLLVFVDEGDEKVAAFLYWDYVTEK